MKTLFKLFLIVFLTSGIWSCSANWHLRKAISKNPDLLKPSYVIISDTLIVPSVQHDTIFQFGLVRDTIVMVQDRLTVRYFYNTKDSTVYLQGECKADTIIREIKVPCPEQVVYEKGGKEWPWILLGVAGYLLLGFILLRKVTKYIN